MGLWQRSMISLARNERLTRFMHRCSSLSTLATRFVGGSTVDDLLATAEALRSSGRTASIYYLGEYVSDPQSIRRTITELKAAAAALGLAGLDVFISVDPTQIGSMIDEATCRANAFEVARAVARADNGFARTHFMLDMEDSSVTETTVWLFEELRAAGLPAAVTLQAYLHRTEADLARCLAAGGALRLVKGAFAERSDVAFTNRAEIDRKFMEAARAMLSTEARDDGFYPIFATHDADLINEIIRIAEQGSWPKDGYEFEMLYGVRDGLQQELLDRGEQVRLYVPFGTDWWPYAVRRVGESPRNARFLVRALVGSRKKARARDSTTDLGA